MHPQSLNCNTARNISIEKTLEKMGYNPIKRTNKEGWYLSPFRNESKASFKVSYMLNRWYDHGEGTGGNIIDLIVRIKNLNVTEALEYLNSNFSFFSFQQQANFSANKIDAKSYKIKKVKRLENKILLDYLIDRKINTEVAKKYCEEIYYSINGKNYFAISFKNNQNGFEIRNKYFKGGLGKKDYTLINNSTNKVTIFEGFIDFLSYLSLFNIDTLEEDFIILNSVALVNRILPLINNYDSIFTCLDNDNSGKKATKLIHENHKNVINCSLLFSKHKDLNEYLQDTHLVDNILYSK